MNISTIIRKLIMILPVILVVGCDEQIDQHGTPSFDYFYLKGSNGESMQKASYEIKASSSSWSPELSIVSTLPISEIETYSNQMWLTSSKNNNSDLTLSATFNNSIEPRYGSIRLSTPDNKHDFYIYVTQRGRDLSISNNGISIGSGASINIPTAGVESLTYEVSADGEYTISKDSNDSWYAITHSKSNNTFFLTTTSSTSSTRKGSIKVALVGLPTGENKEINIDVMQSGRNLALYSNGSSINTGSSITLPVNGGESSVYEVRADGEYTITKGLNDTWYNITHSKINNTFYVTATENTTNHEREGIIIVALAGLTPGESTEIKIRVTQDKNISFDVTIDGNYGNDENWDI